MIRYLLRHPVSVFVTVVVLVALSVLAYFRIPTSLLPDISIPEITVKVTDPQLPSSEIERILVQPLRSQLSQTGHLRSLHSTSQDGAGEIRLTFEYGTAMDLAFIEANEKVDAAMNSLPKDAARPSVTKANASDLPVFTLMVTQDGMEKGDLSEADYLELCDLSRNIIKRRLEQLPEVSLADISGLSERRLTITVDKGYAEALGIDENLIERAFKANDVEAGKATVREESMEYQVHLSSQLQGADDVADIYLTKGKRLLKLKDIATLEYEQVSDGGSVYYNGQRAVALAIVKSPKAKMDKFQTETYKVIETLQEQFPQYTFHITNDQSQILSATMGSLRQNLLLGLLLIFLVSFAFLRDGRLPFVVAVSMCVSLIISVGVMHIFDISLNIISLVGLILSVGMMIDNTLIVTDDITQYRLQGRSLEESCITGTTEVLTPMLSSMLTTIVVFFPLLFLNGMTGELFHDQAYAVSLSLIVSYAVAIALLPVLYKAIVRKQPKANLYSHRHLQGFYDTGIRFVFRHKLLIVLLSLSTLPLCYVLFQMIGKDMMPQFDYKELVVQVDWNERLSSEENRHRTAKITDHAGRAVQESYAYVGNQQYLLNCTGTDGPTKSELYLRLDSETVLDSARNGVVTFLQSYYPSATLSMHHPISALEAIFPSSEAELMLKAYPKDMNRLSATVAKDMADALSKKTGGPVSLPAFSDRIDIHMDAERMALFGVTANEIIRTLQSIFGGEAIGSLHDRTDFVPVAFSHLASQDPETAIARAFVKGDGSAASLPLSHFVSLETVSSMRTTESDERGIYLPFKLQVGNSAEQTITNAQECMMQHPEYDYILEGSYYQNKDMLRSLIFILFVSVVLMYLILTAQFESFVQPLILLLEIPIDIAAGLLCLQTCGQTLNIMSTIGLIVTCGIIVNDSILKVNVINELRRQGTPLKEAIHEAGTRRLRSIVMTSLTSVFALLPVLFSNDLGSELQKPFAIAMIGALTVGTLVSLFIIPLFYWLIYRNRATA